MKKMIALMALMLSLTSCSSINRYMGWSDDWWGEELFEFGVKTQTGVNVDLTPSSKE